MRRPFYLVWYLGCKFVMDDHRDDDDDDGEDDDGEDDDGDEGDDGDVIIEDDDAIAIPLYTVYV